MISERSRLPPAGGSARGAIGPDKTASEQSAQVSAQAGPE